MFYKTFVTIILFNILLCGSINTYHNLGAANLKTAPSECQQFMADTFAEMVIQEEPLLNTEARETITRLSNFIFEKLVPATIEKIEFDENDPSQFTLHFPHAHVGNIPKVEKGAEANFKSINFKVKDKLKGYFSPEDKAIYLEKDAYSGTHSFFKTEYSLNKVKFHINGDQSSNIILETDLGAATKEWKEMEMIATFKHMIWKKG